MQPLYCDRKARYTDPPAVALKLGFVLVASHPVLVKFRPPTITQTVLMPFA
jgi:hypothetical protein